MNRVAPTYWLSEARRSERLKGVRSRRVVLMAVATFACLLTFIGRSAASTEAEAEEVAAAAAVPRAFELPEEERLLRELLRGRPSAANAAEGEEFPGPPAPPRSAPAAERGDRTEGVEDVVQRMREQWEEDGEGGGGGWMRGAGQRPRGGGGAAFAFRLHDDTEPRLSRQERMAKMLEYDFAPMVEDILLSNARRFASALAMPLAASGEDSAGAPSMDAGVGGGSGLNVELETMVKKAIHKQEATSGSPTTLSAAATTATAGRVDASTLEDTVQMMKQILKRAMEKANGGMEANLGTVATGTSEAPNVTMQTPIGGHQKIAKITAEIVKNVLKKAAKTYTENEDNLRASTAMIAGLDQTSANRTIGLRADAEKKDVTKTMEEKQIGEGGVAKRGFKIRSTRSPNTTVMRHVKPLFTKGDVFVHAPRVKKGLTKVDLRREKGLSVIDPIAAPMMMLPERKAEMNASFKGAAGTPPVARSGQKPLTEVSTDNLHEGVSKKKEEERVREERSDREVPLVEGASSGRIVPIGGGMFVRASIMQPMGMKFVKYEAKINADRPDEVAEALEVDDMIKMPDKTKRSHNYETPREAAADKYRGARKIEDNFFLNSFDDEDLPEVRGSSQVKADEDNDGFPTIEETLKDIVERAIEGNIFMAPRSYRAFNISEAALDRHDLLDVKITSGSEPSSTSEVTLKDRHTVRNAPSRKHKSAGNTTSGKDLTQTPINFDDLKECTPAYAKDRTLLLAKQSTTNKTGVASGMDNTSGVTSKKRLEIKGAYWRVTDKVSAPGTSQDASSEASNDSEAKATVTAAAGAAKVVDEDPSKSLIENERSARAVVRLLASTSSQALKETHSQNNTKGLEEKVVGVSKEAAGTVDPAISTGKAADFAKVSRDVAAKKVVRDLSDLFEEYTTVVNEPDEDSSNNPIYAIFNKIGKAMNRTKTEFTEEAWTRTVKEVKESEPAVKGVNTSGEVDVTPSFEKVKFVSASAEDDRREDKRRRVDKTNSLPGMSALDLVDEHIIDNLRSDPEKETFSQQGKLTKELNARREREEIEGAEEAEVEPPAHDASDREEASEAIDTSGGVVDDEDVDIEQISKSKAESGTKAQPGVAADLHCFQCRSDRDLNCDSNRPDERHLKQCVYDTSLPANPVCRTIRRPMETALGTQELVVRTCGREAAKEGGGCYKSRWGQQWTCECLSNACNSATGTGLVAQGPPRQRGADGGDGDDEDDGEYVEVSGGYHLQFQWTYFIPIMAPVVTFFTSSHIEILGAY